MLQFPFLLAGGGRRAPQAPVPTGAKPLAPTSLSIGDPTSPHCTTLHSISLSLQIIEASLSTSSIRWVRGSTRRSRSGQCSTCTSSVIVHCDRQECPLKLNLPPCHFSSAWRSASPTFRLSIGLRRAIPTTCRLKGNSDGLRHPQRILPRLPASLLLLL